MVMGGVVSWSTCKGSSQADWSSTASHRRHVSRHETKWNDPAIKALNPGVKLPHKGIASVHRSDGSGTTFIFTHYLSSIEPEFKSKVGENTSVKWPAGVGGKGNEGVAAFGSRTDGAIGYVEYAYALQNKMTYTLIANHEGEFVSPTSEELPGGRRECRVVEARASTCCSSTSRARRAGRSPAPPSS